MQPPSSRRLNGVDEEGLHTMNSVVLGKLGPGRLGPSKIWRQIGPFLWPNLPFFGKLGPGKSGPGKLGPCRLGPEKIRVRQIGPRKKLDAANWAPANQAPGGTQELSNLHSSPKGWHDIFNTKICFQLTCTPQIVCNIYPMPLYILI